MSAQTHLCKPHKKPYIKYLTWIYSETVIIMMMEVTGKGRACIPGGLTKPHQDGLNQLNKVCLKSRYITAGVKCLVMACHLFHLRLVSIVYIFYTCCDITVM